MRHTNYSLESGTEVFRAKREEGGPEINRCSADWVSLHMLATLNYLTERHQSAFAFLKSGGMKWAETVRHLTPEALAAAARAHSGGQGLQSLAANRALAQDTNMYEKETFFYMELHGYGMAAAHPPLAACLPASRSEQLSLSGIQSALMSVCCKLLPAGQAP